MGNEARKSSTWSRTAVLYKSFYFVFYAGYLPFLLYSPVYFKYLGLSAIQVGLLNGIRPLMQTIGAPLWGILGDRYQIRRTVFLISFVIMTIKTMLFLLFRPENQLCIVTIYGKDNHVLKNNSYVIEHGITKRSEQVLNHALTWKSNVNLLPDNLGSSGAGKVSSVEAFHNKITSISKRSIHEVNARHGAETIYPQTSSDISDINLLAKNASFTRYKTVIDEKEMMEIFVGILVLVIVGETFDGAVFTLADTSCLDTHNPGNYGYFRLWGSAGWGIMAPVIGFVITHFATDKCNLKVGAYFSIFYFYLGFMYLAMLLGSHFDFLNDHNGYVDKTVKSALLNFHYGIFLFVTFYAGFCYGFLLYFVNWFIDSLGGSALIMGTATACKSIVDVLLFFLSGRIIEVLGHLNAVTVSLLVYAIAFVSYSFTTYPWYAVPIEVLHSGAYALVWSSSVSYLNKAAPAGSSATVQGILQGVYWGLGTGGGTIIGGYVIHTYGFVSTFRAFAVITGIVLFVFVMTQLMSTFSDIPNNGDTMNEDISPNDKDNDMLLHAKSDDDSTTIQQLPDNKDLQQDSPACGEHSIND